MSNCNRCKQPLDKFYVNFFDRKYHEKCYVLTLVLYKTIREKERLDEMPIKALHTYLSLRQEYTLQEMEEMKNDGNTDSSQGSDKSG